MLRSTSTDHELLMYLIYERGRQPYGEVILNIPAPLVDRLIGLTGEALAYRGATPRITVVNSHG